MSSLDNQLTELMNTDQNKFAEVIEKYASVFKEKYKKEIMMKKDNLQVIDGTLDQDYYTSLNSIEDWLENCIDEIRTYIQPICYPLFVYLYLELILHDKWAIAKTFFSQNKGKYLKFKDELGALELLKPPLNRNNPVLESYLKNKVHIFIPKENFNFFLHFLNTNRLILVLDILNKYFENSNILSKISDTNSKQNKFIILNNSSNDIDKINSKTSIYVNKVLKDTADQILKGRNRTKTKNLLNDVIIPFPEQLNEFFNVEENKLKINNNNPPNIGCFTMLNANNKLYCLDMTNDGSIIVCGFQTGEIKVWVMDQNLNVEITPKINKDLEIYKNKDLAFLIKNQINLNRIEDEKINNINNNANPENTDKFLHELITDSQRKFSLFGHSSAVYSVSISPDLQHIISGSFDNTVRLWNIHLKSCFAIFKGHFNPVLSVKFSPISHYFASGGCDKTARLWAVNSIGALRVFVGHLSDVELVDFHPNALYLITSSNDKTVRLWTIKSGECSRIFVNYSLFNSHVDCMCFSQSGKILILGVDKGIIIYDLIKMGDPVSIIQNLTDDNMTSIAMDNDENVIVCSTKNYKINFYDLDSILNSEDNLEIDNKIQNKVKLLYSYMTKKTTILQIKFTPSNLMLVAGRFDDNDPKIFN